METKKVINKITKMGIKNKIYNGSAKKSAFTNKGVNKNIPIKIIIKY